MSYTTRFQKKPKEQKIWDWPLQAKGEFVKVDEDMDHFEVGLDAKNFTESEIEVKAIGDILEIHLEHDAKSSTEGQTSRSITRCYKMPANVDARTLRSSLDRDGVLHIKAYKRRL